MKNLNELTLIEAVNGLKNGEFKSVELVSACIDQIQKYDSKIKAFITVLPKDELIKTAKEADKAIEKNKKDAFSKHPLLGIPYACKDNYCTKDIETTAASNILKGFKPPYESTVTQRLKDAGAILLGKTNMDAFAHGASTEASDFFVTRNPWDLEKLPGGSSGGSGAALAANMCTFSIGSDTGGSTRCPASWCGVTGYKPTYGRVSRYGLIAMASSTDCPSPFAKNVEDLIVVMSVVAGKDPLDATSSSKKVEYSMENIRNYSLEGKRIGVPGSYFEMDVQEGVKDKVIKAQKVFEELDAQIVSVNLLSPRYSIAVYTILQRSEVSSNLARFDGIRYGHSRDSFGLEAKKRMMLGSYALSTGYYDQYYSKAQKVRTLIVEDFKKAFEKVDFIIGPSVATVAPDVGSTEKSPMFGEITDALNEPSSIAGIPAVSVTCGFSEGLPVGLQIMAKQFDEELLLGIAAQYQKATNFHTKFSNLEKVSGLS